MSTSVVDLVMVVLVQEAQCIIVMIYKVNMETYLIQELILASQTCYVQQSLRQLCVTLKETSCQMLLPYEEFVKLFQYEVYDISPRGLINCGNSCYANSVLQCLTCTRPLTIYLLRRSHSRACS
ncbi:Ubiquitin carboxyl-terminal hydrolase 15 [Camellia lanceoleosa]|uniref:Ubiquitin carboxyl-terminal hydrolase 15 n=1 Tax=Camellia lanceoleosa TaxID=1840588 RepID=A0ACC0IES8_9ERIC|nr:Ubiquitin carboxyl-terminal hydrolase 15 [Camellia lanceoleosa]